MAKELTERKRQTNPKYSATKIEKLVTKICEEYSKCKYTIKSCCENAGVPYITFNNWVRTFRGFGEDIPEEWMFFKPLNSLYARAREVNEVVLKSELLEATESSLMKRINGFEYEETITEVKTRKDADGHEIMVPVGLKKMKKYMPPSESLIQFALKNLKPEVYGDKVVNINTNTNSNINILKYEKMSIEEIEEEIRKLREH